jgi:hypothetical protein
LINWFVSAFPEEHYLRVLLTSQDIRILTVQFCTHLLAAGVLRQIPDKDVTLEPLFRVSRQLNNGGRGPSSVSSIPELVNGYLLNLGTAVTSQNRVHEGIKSRLNSGNASHHGLTHALSSRFLSAKNMKLKYDILILTVIFYMLFHVYVKLGLLP